MNSAIAGIQSVFYHSRIFSEECSTCPFVHSFVHRAAHISLRRQFAVGYTTADIILNTEDEEKSFDANYYVWRARG